MKIKILTVIISLAALIAYNDLYAQSSTSVNVRIVLRSFVEMEIFEKDVQCEKLGKDIFLRIPLNTFVVPQGEVLRFELLNMDNDSNYSLIYNLDQPKKLTRDAPYFFVHPKRGTDNHRFVLKIGNVRPTAACGGVKESIRFSLEPM
jgi:hypothetical protein